MNLYACSCIALQGTACGQAAFVASHSHSTPIQPLSLLKPKSKLKKNKHIMWMSTSLSPE
jgi:hypothetical protein